jgi:hypothetical protein
MFVFPILLFFLLGASGRRLIPSLSQITLPLHLLPRDAAVNASTVSGITPVAMASDRQYVVQLIHLCSS